MHDKVLQGMETIKILLVGDVVGEPGRIVFSRNIDAIVKKYHIDGVIVNGENSCQTGRGITLKAIDTFKSCGTDVITTGNHVWQQKETYSSFTARKDLIRPHNFPEGVPGTGLTTFTTKKNGIVVGVINLQGRVFMKELLSCPFRAVDQALASLRGKTNVIFVDFHAETTSEKIALAHYVAGRVTGVVGTHTHVQTADERLLLEHTAFISDLGMVGALNGMLGMKKEPIIENFLKQMPTRFAVDTEPPFVFCGVVITAQTDGKAISIERVMVKDIVPC